MQKLYIVSPFINDQAQNFCLKFATKTPSCCHTHTTLNPLFCLATSTFFTTFKNLFCVSSNATSQRWKKSFFFSHLSSVSGQKSFLYCYSWCVKSKRKSWWTRGGASRLVVYDCILVLLHATSVFYVRIKKFPDLSKYFGHALNKISQDNVTTFIIVVSSTV